MFILLKIKFKEISILITKIKVEILPGKQKKMHRKNSKTMLEVKTEDKEEKTKVEALNLKEEIKIKPKRKVRKIKT